MFWICCGQEGPFVLSHKSKINEKNNVAGIWLRRSGIDQKYLGIHFLCGPFQTLHDNVYLQISILRKTITASINAIYIISIAYIKYNNDDNNK